LESLNQCLKTLPPLYRGSSTQLWPILGQIKNVNSFPFIVTMFCGTSKPRPLSAYLEIFIKELKELLEHGFEFEKKKNNVIKIHSVMCDSPARF
jgi:hypothetical protein